MPITVPKAAKLGRSPKFTHALFERVVQDIRDGAPTLKAIEKQGIDQSTFYRYLQRQPDLVPQIQAAQLERDRVRNVSRIEEAEQELKRRGIEGWTEPIFDAKGQQCGERRRFSDACLIFFLKAHKPAVYADRATTVVATQVNITPDREKEIMREWRTRLGAVDPPKGAAIAQEGGATCPQDAGSKTGVTCSEGGAACPQDAASKSEVPANATTAQP